MATAERRLQVFNVVMGCVHLFSGVYILANQDKVPANFRKIQTYTTRISVGEGAEDYGYTFAPAGTANLPVLIGAFFLITAFFHFLYAYGRQTFYRRFIQQGANPLRWLEYSVTATIMAVILALAATVQTTQQLVLIAAATVAIMLLGWVSEKGVATGSRGIALVAAVVAWILQLAVFGVIAYAFISTIRQVNKKLEGEQREERIPPFVYVILIAELILFSLFGVVSAVMLYRSGRGRIDFFNYEVAYHSLSIISKLTLGWVFYVGTLMERA